MNDASGDPVYTELANAGVWKPFGHPISGYETIEDKKPGVDDVVDFFQGYEAKPASEYEKEHGASGLEVEPYGGTAVALPKVMLNAIEFRSWFEIMKPSKLIDAFNPVLVMVENLPVDGTVEEKRKLVYEKFEELELTVSWAPKLKAYRVRPDTDQSAEDFARNVGYLINRVDDLFGEPV